MSDEIIRRDENGVRQQNYRRFEEGKDYMPVCASEEEAITSVILDRFKPGRSTYRKYEDLEEFKQVVVDYFEYIQENNKNGSRLIPDITGFCLFAGIHRGTLSDWITRRPGEFAETVLMLKNAIAAAKSQLAFQNKIPAVVFIASMNNDHNWTNNAKVEITSPSSQLGDALTPEEIAKRIPSVISTDVVEYVEE